MLLPLERQDVTSQTVTNGKSYGRTSRKCGSQGPRFKSPNHYQVLVTYGMNTYHQVQSRSHRIHIFLQKTLPHLY